MAGKLCEYPMPARSLIGEVLTMFPIVIFLRLLLVGFEWKREAKHGGTLV